MHPDTRGAQHHLVRSVVRSPWLWGGFLVSFVTSPALFLSSLVAGGVGVALGAWLWSARRRIVMLALGAGLVLGALPYSLAALRAMLIG